MGEIFEVLPILAGLAIGLVFLRVSATRWRVPAMLAASALCGVLATILTGEYQVSWGFVLLDVALAVGANLVVFYARQLAARAMPR